MLKIGLFLSAALLALLADTGRAHATDSSRGRCSNDLKGVSADIRAVFRKPVYRGAVWGLRIVDTRANLLDTTDTIDRVALDPYSFVRDAFLQRRAAMVLGHRVDEESALPNYEDDDEDTPPAAPAPAPVPATE